MDPAVVIAAEVDAGRGEARAYRQRGDHMTGFVPGHLDGGRPGRPETGAGAAVITLHGPGVVHDGLVVVSDDPAQLSLDPRQHALLGRLHDQGSIRCADRIAVNRSRAWSSWPRMCALTASPSGVSGRAMSSASTRTSRAHLAPSPA